MSIFVTHNRSLTAKNFSLKHSIYMTHRNWFLSFQIFASASFKTVTTIKLKGGSNIDWKEQNIREEKRLIYYSFKPDVIQAFHTTSYNNIWNKTETTVQDKMTRQDGTCLRDNSISASCRLSFIASFSITVTWSRFSSSDTLREHSAWSASMSDSHRCSISCRRLHTT